MAEYEKLGAFYLGRGYDLEKTRVREEDLLYDAKDLTTHAVCVGTPKSVSTSDTYRGDFRCTQVARKNHCLVSRCFRFAMSTRAPLVTFA